MYKCDNCGEVFNEPHCYVETHGFTDGLVEHWSCCPHCGGSYEVYCEDDEEVDED